MTELSEVIGRTDESVVAFAVLMQIVCSSEKQMTEREKNILIDFILLSS